MHRTKKKNQDWNPGFQIRSRALYEPQEKSGEIISKY